MCCNLKSGLNDLKYGGAKRYLGFADAVFEHKGTEYGSEGNELCYRVKHLLKVKKNNIFFRCIHNKYSGPFNLYINQILAH